MKISKNTIGVLLFWIVIPAILTTVVYFILPDSKYVPLTPKEIAWSHSYDSTRLVRTARIIRAMSDSTLYALFGDYNFMDEYPEGERGDSCNCILDDDE